MKDKHITSLYIIMGVLGFQILVAGIIIADAIRSLG